MILLKPLLLVGLGGFLGSISRYGIHLLLSSRSLATFPWGTFTVNILGCLVIGLLVGLETRSPLMTDPWKLLLITGFCGGFTTFSTYSIESLGLLQQQQYVTFLAYAGGSLVVGLLATYLGYMTIRSILY
jgi:CrcB protein